MKKGLIPLLALLLVLLSGWAKLGQPIPASSVASPDASSFAAIAEDGEYTDKESVALYIHTYGRLPGNFITKREAEERGWVSHEGNLHEVLPGMSIGGDHFGNYDNQLPSQKGRKYYECDIDYQRGGRNAKRIIYSSDGLIFYTEDHYQHFERLY